MTTDSDTPTRLEIQPPSRNSKGFLRRQRRAMEMQRLQAGFKQQYARYQQAGQDVPPEVIEQLGSALQSITEFILDYVVVPEDRDLAREAIEDLSEIELMTTLASVVNGGLAPESTLPKTNGTPTPEPSSGG